MRFNHQRAAFDVVLGLDFLQRNFAVLDCGSQRLYLRRELPGTDHSQTVSNALRHAGLAATHLKLKNPLAMTTFVDVNHQPLEMLVDSGAAWTCIDGRQYSRLGLKPQPSTA